MSVETLSFGCRLNHAEAAAMATDAPADARWLVVNSCAVTAEAERQTRQAIRRARREVPDRPILVTGCAAELRPEQFLAMPEVDRVVGNADKLRPGLFARPERLLRSDLAVAPAPPPAAGFRGRMRSFVAIQAGCDHRCTFCTIWQARGPSRSLPFDAVRAAVARELEAGAKEIVLTGVDLTSYAGARGERLGELCAALLAAEPDLQRLRLSSLDGIEMDETLLGLFAREPRLMPHVHLSLQHGDDLMLKRMRRRHLRADALALIARLRAVRPGLTVGTDLIAGFPTESEAAHDANASLIEAGDIVAAHIFPFSPRPGTPAARMPQVEPAVVKARAAALRQVAARQRSAWLDGLVGTTLDVLAENGERGHSDGFAPIALPGAPRGWAGTARVTGRTETSLIGKINVLA